VPQYRRILSHANMFLDSAVVHPWIDSCLDVPVERFWHVFRWMVPIYGALHFIPMILFKRAALVRHPARLLLRAAGGTARSAAFLGTFVVIYQCACQNLCFAAVAHNHYSIYVLEDSVVFIKAWRRAARSHTACNDLEGIVLSRRRSLWAITPC
jgi:hypothetical protein